MHDRLFWIRGSWLSLNHRRDVMIANSVTSKAAINVNIVRFVSSIFLRPRIVIFLSHFGVPTNHHSNDVDDAIIFPLVKRVKLIQRRQQDCWGRIQAFSDLEVSALHRFAKLVRKNAPRPPHRTSNHHIIEFDVMLLARRSSFDSHHQPEADRFEGAKHVLRPS